MTQESDIRLILKELNDLMEKRLEDIEKQIQSLRKELKEESKLSGFKIAAEEGDCGREVMSLYSMGCRDLETHRKTNPH